MEPFLMKKMISFKSVSKNQELILIEEMAHVIWHEHYTAIIGAEQVAYMLKKFQTAEAMAAQISKGYQYFLILEEEKPVGYLSYEKRKDALFLSKIYLLKSSRGKGYGRKAMRFVEARARENQCVKISLTVNKYNLNSIKAYERAGFLNTGAIVQDIGKGFVMDDYQMEKFI